jgi:hypothetical protein
MSNLKRPILSIVSTSESYLFHISREDSYISVEHAEYNNYAFPQILAGERALARVDAAS